eukprot:748198-Hanusia_phi.AAC.1
MSPLPRTRDAGCRLGVRSRMLPLARSPYLTPPGFQEYFMIGARLSSKEEPESEGPALLPEPRTEWIEGDSVKG